MCRHLSALTGVSFTKAIIKDLPRNMLFGVHVFIQRSRDGHLSKFPISLMNNARVSAAWTDATDTYIAAIANDDKSEREWVDRGGAPR